MIYPTELTVSGALHEGHRTFAALCARHEIGKKRPDRRLVDNVLQEMRKRGAIYYDRTERQWRWGRGP